MNEILMVIVGAFASFLQFYSFKNVKFQKYSSYIKFAIAIGFSVIVSALPYIYNFLQSDETFNLNAFFKTLGLVFSGSQIIFNLYFKKLIPNGTSTTN